VGFLIDLILLVHYDSGFGSASNRHEFSGISAGGKGGRCMGLTTLPPPGSRFSGNFGSLNLLEL